MNISETKNAEVSSIHFSIEQTTQLKGIAIFLILFDHTGENVGILPSTPLGGVGVYIFLFLSGYGLMRSAVKNGVRGFWQRRIKKVYIPYLLILILCALMSLIVMDSISPNFLRYLCFSKLIFGEFWYLRLQILWYVAFFFIWILKEKIYLSPRTMLGLLVIADLLIVTLNISDRKYAWTLGAFVIGGGMAYMVRNLYAACVQEKLRLHWCLPRLLPCSSKRHRLLKHMNWGFLIPCFS